MNQERRQYFAKMIAEGRNQEVLSQLEASRREDEECSSSFGFFRGVALQNLGRLDESVGEYEDAAKKALSDLLGIWNNLASAQFHRGHFSDAAKVAEQLRPYFPYDADLLSLHVMALKQAGDVKEAESIARQFSANLPRNAVAARWLVHMLWRNGHYLEALLRASDIPVSRWGQTGLGYELLYCLMELGLFETAEQVFPVVFGSAQGALDSEEMWACEGLLAFLKGELARAQALFEEGLARGYTDSGSIVNLGCVLLTQGDFADGWRHYLARNDESVLPGSQLCEGVPRWQGEPVAGKTLLIVSEQGTGDVIQFLRFVPEIERLGARVVFAAYPDVVGLLANDPQARKVEIQPLSGSDIDYQARLLDLPFRLGVKAPSDVPQRIPYLFANPAKMADWSESLAMCRGLRVGLVWAGYAGHGGDHFRSASINIFSPLAGIPGVRFFGLQKGAGIREARCAPEGLNFQWIGDRFASFDDTAAAIANLDLVISVDTSVAHLAAALGKPVWMLASLRNPDWRWTDHGSGNAWYPNLTVFRQQKADDWVGMMRDRIRPALARWILDDAKGNMPSWQEIALQLDCGRLEWTRNNWTEWSDSVEAEGATVDAARWLSRQLAERDISEVAVALVTRVGDVEALANHPPLAIALARHYLKKDRAETALNLFERIAQADGDAAVGRAGFVDWGWHFHSRRQWSQAKDIWGRAVQAFPLDGHLHYLLGTALRDGNQKTEALVRFRKALECSPRHYMAHLAISGLLFDDQPAEAYAAAQKAIMFKSNDVVAWQSIVRLFHTRGMYWLAERILLEKGDVECDSSSRTLRIRQLLMLGRRQEAFELLDQMTPNRDSPVKEQQQYAGSLYQAGRRDEALQLMTDLADRFPESREARFSLGFTQLRLGRCEAGWKNYWLGMRRETRQKFAEWKGEDLSGKSLLIVQDQGQGDAIQFFPLLHDVWAMAPKRLTLAVSPALVTLFRAQGLPFEIVDAEKLDWDEFRYDYQVEQMALPYLLGVDLLRPQRAQPTLMVPEGLVPNWRDRLENNHNLRVGIVWSGGDGFKANYVRSTALEDWRVLWEIEGISFFSLQKDVHSNQAAVFDLPLSNIAADCPTWLETMAVIDSLDLVITTCTAAAHVAGSINKPTWVVLSNEFVDYRWMEDREDSPWYPSVRLIRRQQGESWQQVFSRIACDLVARFERLAWKTVEVDAQEEGK